LFIISLRPFPALKTGALEAGMSITCSGSLGFLPCLAALSLVSKVPNPTN